MPASPPPPNDAATGQLPADPQATTLVPGRPPEGLDLSFLAPPPRPGLLGRLGPYEVVGLIGQGGMGAVFEGIDPTLNRHVAIKVMAADLATSPEARQRFLREARSAAAVRHPAVVAIHAVDEAAGLPYLVMQLVEGGSVEERLRDGALPVPEAVRLVAEVAEGLAAAHAQGLVHRDIKPGNILIEHSSGQARLTDFGLARAADDVSLTRTGAIIGTPLYMAPEQARAEKIDHRADLFSLGSVLYTLLAGVPPFRADNTLAILRRVCNDVPRPIREVNPAVPDWLDALLGRLLAKDRNDRLGSAALLARLLRQGQAHLEHPHQTPPPVVPVSRRSPAWKRLAVLAGAVALLAVCLAGWRLLRPAPTEPDVAPTPAAEGTGWTPLFNGTDLTGWRRHLTQPGDWRVRDGEIVAVGPTSHLYTSRGGLADFRLRLEVMLEPGDEAALLIRSTFGPRPVERGVFPEGYAVRLGDDPEPHRPQTGSLEGLRPCLARHARTGEWIKIEVRATGRRIETWVNAQPAVDFEDARGRFRQGHIALRKVGRGTKIRFRKIEIREEVEGPVPAPASPPAPQTRVVFQTRPDTAPLPSPGVRLDPGQGWRVEPGKTTAPLPLLAVDRPDFSTGRLACRFQVRGEKPGTGHASLIAYYSGLGAVRAGPVPFPLTPAWATAQVSLFNFLSGRRPDRVVLAVHRAGGTPFWVRDVELVYTAVVPNRQEAEPMRPAPVELSVTPAGTLIGHTGPVAALAVAPGGEEVASGGQDGRVVLWSRTAEGWRRQELLATRGPVRALGFAADGKALAAGDSAGELWLWRRQPAGWGEPVLLARHGGPIRCLAWAPDGRRLAVGEGLSRQARVRLWDVAQRKAEVVKGTGASQAVRGVIFSPDGKRLGMGLVLGRQTVIVWADPSTGKVVEQRPWNLPWDWATVFRPDGGMIAATVNSRNVGIWWQQGKTDSWQGQWYSGHGDTVQTLAFSGDRHLLASGGTDRTIRLRDADSGTDLATLSGHEDEVSLLAFSADGRLLASAGGEGTVKLWQVERSAGATPFVVLARAGAAEQAHASLAAAARAARDGDVIEVRGNGPFITPPVRIAQKALTIRAGLGYWPLLVLDPDHSGSPTNLIWSTAPLVLEGLELHRAPVKDAGGSFSLVSTSGATLRLAHCRLVNHGPCEALRVWAGSSCEMRSCILMSPDWATLSAYNPHDVRLLLDNCLLTGQGLHLRDRDEKTPIRNVAVDVRRCTFVGRRVLELLVEYPPGKAAVPPGPEADVRVRVSDSLLDARGEVLRFDLAKPAGRTEAETEATLRRRLSWRDHNCLFAVGKDWLDLAHGGRSLPRKKPVRSRAAWDQLWQQKDSGSSTGTPAWPPGSDRAELAGPGESLLPGDFRLAGQQVGADVDQLGPGSAYWRWRESPAYEKWRAPAP